MNRDDDLDTLNYDLKKRLIRPAYVTRSISKRESPIRSDKENDY